MPAELSWALYVLYLAAATVFLVLENRSPQSTFAWLFLMVLAPGVGPVVYFMFGRGSNAFSHRKALRRQLGRSGLSKELAAVRDAQAEVRDALSESEIEIYNRLPQLLWNSTEAPVTMGNEVEILQNASEKYPRLLDDLRRARHLVHMEYYEWADDPLTREVLEILRERVRAGVTVRALYDPVGSFSMLTRGYVRDLRAAGVQVYPYSPIWRLHTISYRNHRKLVIIDSEIGYTGGLNLTDKHLTGPKGFSGWRDTHVRVCGDAVATLQYTFALQWFNTTGELLGDPALYPRGRRPGAVPIQVVNSGPDSQYSVIRQQYLAMISMARDHVYLQSPFCVLDESVLQVLCATAMSGVRVWVMIAPRGGEGPLAYRAGMTYARDLAKAGVRVLLYQGAYFHCKTIAVDSVACSIGSANMDIRSFTINYETNLVIYDREVTRRLETAFLADIRQSEPFSAEAYQRLPPYRRLGDSVMRLFSPLL
ncbi:cardiolipin synthase [Luteitalea sp. TBR-22]|uniref:cardiolipin synthase n=1 Tax=Luteitalea sp. TBR-22 TaxID=2802971 RepID=UPI001AF2E910|nr:cardiolipin synthase [Luteitalea sp. TBR-22]BCS31969.1 cardiolipin synthase [Luteitalea sp. TBR-22]